MKEDEVEISKIRHQSQPVAGTASTPAATGTAGGGAAASQPPSTAAETHERFIEAEDIRQLPQKIKKFDIISNQIV